MVGWSNEIAYLKYLHGLMQPVIFLMSSYLNWKRPSVKSSKILEKKGNIQRHSKLREANFPPVLPSITAKRYIRVTPIVPPSSTPSLLKMQY